MGNYTINKQYVFASPTITGEVTKLPHKLRAAACKRQRSRYAVNKTALCGLTVGVAICLLAIAWRPPIQSAVSIKASGEAGTSGKVTIVSVPGWSFLDWSDEWLSNLPNVQRLIREGAIGAMNVRTQEKGLEDVYATMGAGAPATSSPDYSAWNAIDASGGRTGFELYRRLTGIAAAEENVVVPDIAAIRRRNDNRSQRALPGLLGELLRKNGISAFVFGNSDLPPSRKRYAPLLLMDENGLIPTGDVGERTLLADAGSPFSVRTNVPKLLERLDTSPQSSVLLLEWGDLLRYQSEAASYGAELAERRKLESLRNLDAAVGDIWSRKRDGDSIWLISPRVGSDAVQRKMPLAPIVYSGPDARGGLLSSPSTRRAGIVTAADFAPSVLSAFGIEAPNDMVGRVMSITSHPEPLTFMRKELDTIREVYRTRPRVLIPFVSVEAVVLLAALTFVWVKFGKAARWIEAMLLALLAAPLSLLAIGWLSRVYPLSGGAQTALFVASILAVACSFAFVRGGRSALIAAALLSGITVLALLFDGVTGAEGMKRSVLGYDSIIGARYYGMGNEFMGVFVGAATFAFAAAMEQRRRRRLEQRNGAAFAAALSAAAFAAALLYLAAPQLGTNAGGAITAAVAFGLAWLASFNGGGIARRSSLLQLVLVCTALVAAAVAALWLLNAATPADAGRQSHIGRAMALLGNGRTDLIAAILVRKLQMNAHLIGVSVWTKVFAAGLLVMAAAVVRPRGVFRRWEAAHPHYMSGFIAIAVGSVAALAFNDSGIVAAATMIVYAAVPMLLLRIQDDSSSHSA